jgi:uncharacterized membrane protein (UPF0127 family)
VASSTVTSDWSTVTFHTASGDKKFIVEVARTPSKQQQGLMYRTQLAADRGMLFVYDRNQDLRFWMKNTLIPLDMIFVGEDGIIVNIVRNAQPCTADPCQIYASSKPARFVVELQGGVADASGIKEGDFIQKLP